MTDTKSEPNYQDILDKYADSIKPTELSAIPKPEPDLEPNQTPESLLDTELTPESKLEIHPQEEGATSTEVQPESVAELHDIPQPETEPEIETKFESPDQAKSQTHTETSFESPEVSKVSSEPEIKTEIKSEPLNLTTPPVPEAIVAPEPPTELASELPDSLPPKENHFFKYLFFFSLFIFIIVLVSVIFSFINSQKSLSDTKNTPTTVPPTIGPDKVCEINGQTYAVGETFSATDGCNSCSCDENLQIACTTMACEATPSTKLTPTKSATTSALRSQIENWTSYTKNLTKLSWDKCGDSEAAVSISIKDTISKETAYIKTIDNYKIYYTPKLNFTVDNLKKFETCAVGDLTPRQIIGDKIIWANGCGGILNEAALKCDKILKEIENIYKL